MFLDSSTNRVENQNITDTSTMDSLEVVTYLLAALGVIVLGLCIVVASLLIYQYCRYKLNCMLRFSPI